MSLESIKNRISSIQTTSKITNAMKLVAASKLNRQKKTYEQTKDYYSEYYKVIGTILKMADKKLFEPSDNPTTLYIVINSSMGLCGGYNNNVYKLINNAIKKDDFILNIGKKGIDHYKKEESIKTIDLNIIDINHFEYADAALLASEVFKMFKDKKFDSIKIVYTKFVNAITFEPTILDLIPFDDKFTSNTEILKENMFDFEPSKEQIIKDVLPQYLSSVIYASLLESSICENASRRNAMDNATDNAKDLISNCKLLFNRLRQAKITNEITEIVAGSNEN